MKSFKGYHPMVNFIYFLGVIGFSMCFFSPIALAVSLVSGFSHSLVLKGVKALKFNLFYMLPLLILTAVINPLFNHQGITILAYFPSGNPLTLEAVLYGIASGTMLWSVICHFSAFNEIMTQDKIGYLLGKIAPRLSVIFTMILRLVPRFNAQLGEIRTMQHLVYGEKNNGRIKREIRALSLLFTWSVENSLETADGMKSRGYGLKGRTSYTPYTLGRRDIWLLICLLAFGTAIVCFGVTGAFKITFYPSIAAERVTFLNLWGYAAYALFFFSPVIIEIREELKWKKLQSKI